MKVAKSGVFEIPKKPKLTDNNHPEIIKTFSVTQNEKEKLAEDLKNTPPLVKQGTLSKISGITKDAIRDTAISAKEPFK